MKRSLWTVLLVVLLAAAASAQTLTLTQGASDNFERANGSPGSNWTAAAGTWAISSDVLYLSTASGNYSPLYYSGTTFNANQYSSLTLYTWYAANTYKIGPAVRISGSAGGSLYAYCSATGGSGISSTCSQVSVYNGTSTTSFTLSSGAAQGSTLTVAAIGSYGIVEMNSTVVAVVSIPSCSSGCGAPGIQSYEAGSSTYSVTSWAGGAPSMAPNASDNFSGDTIGSAILGWNKVSSSYYVPNAVSGGLQSSGNAVSITTYNDQALAYYTALLPASGVQFSQLSCHMNTSGGDLCGVAVNVNTSGTATAYVLYFNAAMGELYLNRIVSGTSTTIVSKSISLTGSGSDFTLNLTNNNGTLTPLLNGSTPSGLSATYTDTNISATSGNPGVYVYAGASGSSADTYGFSWSGGQPTAFYSETDSDSATLNDSLTGQQVVIAQETVSDSTTLADSLAAQGFHWGSPPSDSATLADSVAANRQVSQSDVDSATLADSVVVSHWSLNTSFSDTFSSDTVGQAPAGYAEPPQGETGYTAATVISIGAGGNAVSTGTDASSLLYVSLFSPPSPGSSFGQATIVFSSPSSSGSAGVVLNFAVSGSNPDVSTPGYFLVATGFSGSYTLSLYAICSGQTETVIANSAAVSAPSGVLALINQNGTLIPLLNGTTPPGMAASYINACISASSGSPGFLISDQTFTANTAYVTQFSAGSIGAHYPETIADAATTADAVSTQALRPRSMSDTATIADAVYPQAGHNAAISDFISASDSLVMNGRFIGMSDQTSFADAITMNAARAKSATDATAFTDSLAPGTIRGVGLSDSISISDVIGWGSTLADSTSLIDFLAVTAYSSAPFGDTLTMLDGISIATYQSASLMLFDSVTLADGITEQNDLSRPMTDATTVADAVAGAASRHASTADAATVTDAASAGLFHARAASDTATLTDAGTGAASHRGAVTDSLTTADAVGAFAGQIIIADTAVIGDAPAAVLRHVPGAADSVTLSDSPSGMHRSAGSLSDSASVADLLTGPSGKGVAAQDSLALADSAASGVRHGANASEGLAVSDSILLSSARGALPLDSSTLADSLAYMHTYMAQGPWGLSDRSQIADSLRGARSLAPTASDGMTLADSPTTAGVRSAAAIDSLSFADSAAKLARRAGGGTDSAAMVDALARAAQHFATVLDSVAAPDAVMIGSGRAAMATDGALIGDEATYSHRYRTGLFGMFDAATFWDGIVAYRETVTLAADTAALLDTASAVRLAVAKLDDDVAGRDAIAVQKFATVAVADDLAADDSLSSLLRPWRKRTIIISN